MPILPSRAGEIQRLIADLGAESAARRDSAVARLTLLGERAIAPVLASLATARPVARREALRVIEHLRDPRAVPELLALAASPSPEVARRAVEVSVLFPEARVARALAQLLASAPPPLRRAVTLALARLHGAGLVEATDALLDLLLDEDEEEGLRLVALDALSSLDAKDLTGLLGRVRSSRAARLAERAADLSRGLPESRDTVPRALLQDVERLARAGVDPALASRITARGLEAADLLLDRLRSRPDPELAGRIGQVLRGFDPRVVDRIHRALPQVESPAALVVLAEVLGHFKAPGSIPALHRTLERLGEGRGRRAHELDAAKARIHVELAGLGSRIALYDLREMLLARPITAAPVLLGAARLVGDASLLPALAALADDDPDCRDGCAAALAAIVRREGLRRTSRQARLKSRKHQAVLDAMWPAASRARR